MYREREREREREIHSATRRRSALTRGLSVANLRVSDGSFNSGQPAPEVGLNYISCI